MLNYTILNNWLGEIDSISPFIELRESVDEDVHTIYRRGNDALILYLDSFVNNEMCRGYAVPRDDIQVCNSMADVLKYISRDS